jgi:hypothetical protein
MLEGEWMSLPKEAVLRNSASFLNILGFAM